MNEYTCVNNFKAKEQQSNNTTTPGKPLSLSGFQTHYTALCVYRHQLCQKKSAGRGSNLQHKKKLKQLCYGTVNLACGSRNAKTYYHKHVPH